MTDLERAAVVLLATGLLGALTMCVYLRACAWAEWDLMPVSYQRRAEALQRRATPVLGGSAGVAAAGVALWLIGLAA